MRNRLFAMVAALLLVSGGAKAQSTSDSRQQDVPKASAAAPSISDIAFENEIDFGVRGTSFGSNADKARFERYRDLRNGGTLDRLRFSTRTDQYVFNAQADHVGYRDQRYSASYNNYGRVKMSFEWNQIPLFYSETAAWLYTDQGNGALKITNPAVQTGIQSGTLKVVNANAFLGSPFDLRQRRDTATFNLTAAVAKNADLKVSFASAHKDGQMPWGASFGFSAANEIAAPFDHRTNDLGASFEWANEKGMARIGYDGSWFSNSIQTLTFDSPYKATDSTNPIAYVFGNGTSQGRMAMWPDSTANTVSGAAGYNLPGRSRLNGAFSFGDLRQNAALLPFTINTAIAPIPLDRATADAEARITNLNVNFVSRPTDIVWFNVRARRYDYDNRTPVFQIPQYVRLDQVLEPGNAATFISYTRNYVDADVSLTPLPYTAFKAGYGMQKVDRTERYFASTNEQTLRASVDSTGFQYGSVRLAYEHSKRTGSGFDPAILSDAGEHVDMNHYDIGDRDRNRITASATLTPISQFSVFASAATGRDDYNGIYFGLQKWDTNTYSVGFDATPIETVGFGLTYSYEDQNTAQRSRTANPGPQFLDATRDWSDNASEKVHYIVASMDLTKAIPRTDIRFALDWNKSNGDYVYSLPANTTLPTPTQLPTLLNELTRASVDFKYFVTKHLAAGFVYWYEDYKVDDFALGQQYVYGNRTLPEGVMLGYFQRPYRANTGWFRLSYLW